MEKLRVFSASPSDMATERAKIETIASMLKPLADNLGIVLDVVDWRDVVPDMGRPEQVILDHLKPSSWDVFRDSDLQKFIFQEASRELTENDQSALRALSFFAPSATFEAWMEVAELSRNALETTIDRLSALSLVDVLEGAERYALHPLTRNFVRDELMSDTKIRLNLGKRFADYWVSYTERYGGGIESYKTYNRLEAEWSNINAAEEWLWQTAAVQDETIGNKDAANMLCSLIRPLWLFLLLGGRWEHYLRSLEIAEKIARKDNQAIIYGALGGLAFELDRLAEAREWFERELSLACEVGSRDLIAEAQYGLARMHEAEGESELALPLAQEALIILERLQHRQLAAGRELVERLKKKVNELHSNK